MNMQIVVKSFSETPPSGAQCNITFTQNAVILLTTNICEHDQAPKPAKCKVVIALFTLNYHKYNFIFNVPAPFF